MTVNNEKENRDEAIEFLLNFISACNCMGCEDYRDAYKAMKILEESIIVPIKQSEVHIMETDCSQNVSDNSNHDENVSDKNQLDVEIGCGVLPVYTKKMKLRIPKEVKDALDAVGRSDSLPRKMKGDPCFPHGDDEPVC